MTAGTTHSSVESGRAQFLDFTAPGFSTRSEDVFEAQSADWCAETPYGLAVLRHTEAGLLIRDKRLRQGSYTWPDANGLTGSFAEFWKRSLISMEGDRHRQIRRIAEAALSPRFIESLQPEFEALANELVDQFPRSGQVEFIEAFGLPYAARAVCALLGMNSREDWDAIAKDAAAMGLAMVVDCRRHQAKFNAACSRLLDLAALLVEQVRRGSMQHGYVARLVSGFAEQKDLDESCLRDLVVITIFGGVDTTKSQLGSAMALFAEHSEQWQALRSDPELASQAVEEVVRHRPATTWVTREAKKDLEFEGRIIPAGQTVHLLVHASAFDPAVVPVREFDISARRKAHLGFGGGVHHCLGHLVARTDMACAVRVLSRRLKSLELQEEPQWLPATGNTGLERLRLACRFD